MQQDQWQSRTSRATFQGAELPVLSSVISLLAARNSHRGRKESMNHSDHLDVVKCSTVTLELKFSRLDEGGLWVQNCQQPGEESWITRSVKDDS